jgi:predicted PurR-regulated permease PerM
MPEVGWRRLAATATALFVAVLLLLFLSQVREVLLLIFIAAIVAIYFSAVTDVLVQHVRLARAVGLTVAVLLTLVGVAGVGAIVVPLVVRQVQDLLAALPSYVQGLDALLSELAEEYPVFERMTTGGQGGGLVGSVIDAMRGSVFSYLLEGGKLAVELVSVLAMAIYIARNPGRYREGLIALFPPRVRHIARTTLADLGITLRTWIWAQLFAMTVLGVLTWVGLWALRVPYALAFGVFTGVVAIVPFFGTIVSTILPALLVLGLNGWVHAIAVAGLGVAVHLVEANVVAPVIFEHRINLPPVLTIASVLIMATLLGPLGLVVAVPTLAVALVVTRNVLFSEIYHELDITRATAAVLVDTRTGERPVIVVPQEQS